MFGRSSKLNAKLNIQFVFIWCEIKRNFVQNLILIRRDDDDDVMKKESRDEWLGDLSNQFICRRSAYWMLLLQFWFTFDLIVAMVCRYIQIHSFSWIHWLPFQKCVLSKCVALCEQFVWRDIRTFISKCEYYMMSILYLCIWSKTILLRLIENKSVNQTKKRRIKFAFELLSVLYLNSVLNRLRQMGIHRVN